MRKIDYIILILIVIAALTVGVIAVVASDSDSQGELVPVVIEAIEEEPEIIEIEIDPEVLRRSEYFEKLAIIDKIKDDKEWYVAYIKLNEEYSDIKTIETLYDAYSEEDIQFLQRVVETECYGADFNSKVNVACIVLNRVNNNRFPETIKQVVTQPKQFAYGRQSITEDTALACEYAYLIGNDDLTDCLFFHSMAKSQQFSGADYVLSDNCHHFYK